MMDSPADLYTCVICEGPIQGTGETAAARYAGCGLCDECLCTLNDEDTISAIRKQRQYSCKDCPVLQELGPEVIPILSYSRGYSPDIITSTLIDKVPALALRECRYDLLNYAMKQILEGNSLSGGPQLTINTKGLSKCGDAKKCAFDITELFRFVSLISPDLPTCLISRIHSDPAQPAAPPPKPVPVPRTSINKTVASPAESPAPPPPPPTSRPPHTPQNPTAPLAFADTPNLHGYASYANQTHATDGSVSIGDSTYQLYPTPKHTSSPIISASTNNRYSDQAFSILVDQVNNLTEELKVVKEQLAYYENLDCCPWGHTHSPPPHDHSGDLAQNDAAAVQYLQGEVSWIKRHVAEQDHKILNTNLSLNNLKSDINLPTSNRFTPLQEEDLDSTYIESWTPQPSDPTPDPAPAPSSPSMTRNIPPKPKPRQRKSKRKPKVKVIGSSMVRDQGAHLSARGLDATSITCPGRRAEQITPYVKDMTNEDDEYIVCGGGTNNIATDQAIDAIINIGNHIDSVRATRPKSHIILPQILQRYDSKKRVAQNEVANRVNMFLKHRASKDKNMSYLPLTVTREDLYDGLHMDYCGKDKVASSIASLIWELEGRR